MPKTNAQRAIHAMIDPDLLRILCCPETHQPLAPAPPAILQRLNTEARAGRLRNQAGREVAQPLEEGLLRQDGRCVYPVRGGIPILLAGEAISVD